MRGWLALLAAVVALALALPARAEERITSFDVLVSVQQNGDIVVAETITATVEGVQIQRGIFRDLPRYYESRGARLPFAYQMLSVERDGQAEPYETSQEGNAFRVRIGDADVFLDHGAHTWLLRYRVKNQVRYFDDYDEVYWNATGNYWAFAIEHARATIELPRGARITGAHGYTGLLGATGSDYRYAPNGARHVFETTRPLGVGEGLTVAVGFGKGLIDPPSAADKGWEAWRRYGALALMLASLGGLFWFLYSSFERVGRDPPKGPVFPRYEPPADISPAAAHHIYHRGVSGHQAVIATLMNLAVKGRLSIDASEKRETTLTRAPSPPETQISAEDSALEARLFAHGDSKTFGKKYDSAFTSAYNAFTRQLGVKYGRAYFRWNFGYTALALILTAIAIFVAVKMASSWTVWHTAGVIGLAGLNVLFMYLMPAPTPLGQQVRTEIEGFKLYMETAEKLQLNAVEVGGEAPPPMTAERYERFLPYAVALGVEKPWTRHFERLLPEEAANYHPRWASSHSSGRSLAAFNSAMLASMTSGVTSALPQSSGSSGSGGGGSSGGGGGGGGGGGW